MKKLALVVFTTVCALCLASAAFSATINPGASTSCKDANAITLEAKGSHPTDRGNANAVIWKSSNFTTIPVSLGPTDTSGLPGGSAGNSKELKKPWDRGGQVNSAPVNMSEKSSKGRSSVTFTSQSNFSRGDSIGDISGLVKITNTGTVGIEVTCK